MFDQVFDCQQEKALQLMLQGKNLFISGRAGTGKSEIIREVMRQKKEDGIEPVLLAPTGIAAENIGGLTIHRFFGFPIRLITEQDLYHLSKTKIEKLQAVQTIIIDEISMVSSNVFWAMDFILKNATEQWHLPFGGKQVIVIGDFAQLPPVIPSDKVMEFMLRIYGGSHAFQTSEWENACFNVVELLTQYRQHDPLFQKILNIIRCNGGGDFNIVQDALNILNSKCAKPYNIFNKSISLCTVNKLADQINERKLSKLQTRSTVFKAYLNGVYSEEKRPTKIDLEIKLQSKVMILANEPMAQADGYANGDIGIVVNFKNEENEKWVEVKLKRNNRTVTIFPFAWQEYTYDTVKTSYKPALISKIAGEFVQIPLKPAYAGTIHKFQGKTLDEAHLQLGGHCFASGQLYVALSRLSSMEGLTINRNLTIADVLVNPDVIDFYDEMDDRYGFGSFVRSCMSFDPHDSYAVHSLSSVSNEITIPI